jgi:ribosomal protein S6--L-glutamate ligase
MNTKILIIVGGPKKKLDPFREANDLGVELTLASFSDLNFFSKEGEKEPILRIGEEEVNSFDVIYIRMVGKRLEDATILADYAIKKGITLIDRLYTKPALMPASLSKAMETELLIKGGVPVPPTLLGSLETIGIKAGELLGFPLVVKSTSGKKARDVWSPLNQEELNKRIEELTAREKAGEKFFAQKFIEASQRIRVFVIGENVIGAITRPTKWRKRFVASENLGEKGKIEVIDKLKELALLSAKAVSLDIAGIDILKEDKTGKLYVIEANAAPSWRALARDTGINIEREILKYLRDI